MKPSLDWNQKKEKLMMDFDLIVAENCSACERAESKLREYSVKRDFIIFKISLQKISTHKTTIVPSLFINGKLFSYGDIDIKSLEQKVRKLNREGTRVRLGML